MASTRSPLGELTTIAAANDLDRNGTTFDLTGAAGCIIAQVNDGTAGTAGIDVIEFSRDGGDTWAAATAANIGGSHAGLIAEDGSAAAAASAALNAAGTEPAHVAFFSLGPMDGPCLIRVAPDAASGTAWVTGAPSVVAIRIG